VQALLELVELVGHVVAPACPDKCGQCN
jgi:hypothetical protein